MSKVKVVDVHTHAAPTAFVEAARREGGRFGFRVEQTGEDVRFRVTTPDGVTVEVDRARSDERTRQGDMAEVGIDFRMQSVLPGLMSYGAGERQAEWFCRTINDAHGEDMRAAPDHLTAMASVPLQFPAMAVRELERVIADHGMRCVQIATNVNGENLDQPQFSPFWEAVEGLGLLVFIHPRYQVGKHRMSRYHLANLIGNPLETSIAAASLIFGGVLERYPTLKVCLAHSGGFAPWIRGRWRHGFDVRGRPPGAPRSFDKYFALLHFDTVIHDELALRYLIEAVGADHVLHGTDYPADMGNWDQASLIRGLPDISEKDMTMILGGNTLRLVGAS